MIPRVFDPTEAPTPHLVHFVGRARGTDPLPLPVNHLNAEQRLAAILSTGRLRGFPVHGTGDVPVIGASDISPADLQAAFRTGLNERGAFEPWALVLERDLMWGAGSRPVLYVGRGDYGAVQQALHRRDGRSRALVQRLDLLMNRSDWTHEREWRWIAPSHREELPVWPLLHAIIVGASGWQPPALAAHSDAHRVERWWWGGGELVDDGMVTEPSPYR